MEDKATVLLEAEDLTTKFRFSGKELIAVNNVSLKIQKKEIVGLVGESGCGKSMTAFSILKIVPHPGETTSGRVLFNGIDLLKLKNKDIRKIRGNEISLVYQDPLSSLNPSFNIYWQLNEVVRSHRPQLKEREKYSSIIEILKKVGIPNPEKKVFQYPHQYSGGMRQRVVIAMAIILGASLVIADEPTTSLDVTTQREIFDLNEVLKEELGISFIVISHDLYLIAERCDRIYVMYSGEIVESASSEEIFNDPLHPYTKGLLRAIPGLSPDIKKLGTIDGEVQDLMNLPEGCFFQNRCQFVDTDCRNNRQILREVAPNRSVRCHKVEKQEIT
jgi:oligopeptide/dipeptide ABC transporter ATP-binding protein